MNQDLRVAYFEARAGELASTIGDLRAEIVRLRREVEFEANAIDPGCEGGYNRDNLRFPLCSCLMPGQAAAMDFTRWSRPQCCVHPDRGGNDD